MPECADFFPLDDEYVLMFSRNSHRRSTVFVRGDFDGTSFTPKPDGVSFPEIGPHFYAPQTFAAPDGRRILFGWVLDRGIQAPPNQRSQSCMSLPRELSIEDGRIKSRPAREALPFLRKEKTYAGETLICYDTKSIEIFDESGENVLTLWQPDAAAAETGTKENAAF
jgi:beta-fructofuranosidase